MHGKLQRESAGFRVYTTKLHHYALSLPIAHWTIAVPSVHMGLSGKRPMFLEASIEDQIHRLTRCFLVLEVGKQCEFKPGPAVMVNT